MDIEEKQQAIKKYCRDIPDCKYCVLSEEESACYIKIADEHVDHLYNLLIYGTKRITRNIAEVSDAFICDKCGIHLEDFSKVVYDEDAEDTSHFEYKFKFCPECGRRVVEE